MVDYSKWNHIEVSDDEDDTHPNIDTPSLFRWRHKARVERMEALNEKYKSYTQRKEMCENEMKILNDKIAEAKKGSVNNDEIESYQKEMKDLKIQAKNLDEEGEMLNKELKTQPKNVDTLSREKFSKSHINPVSSSSKPKTDEEICEKLTKFLDGHKKDAKNFGMLSKPEDSAKYIIDHPYIASEEAASYLCLWCIDLAVEEKFSLMERVAQQAVSLQFLLEISNAQRVHPRDMVPLFFSKIKNMDKEYQQSFETEVAAFKKRVMDRAKIRIEEAQAELEKEEKQKRLGPGGLDPVEVMETLPPELKECFVSRDVEMLKRVISEMNPEDAEYHFKRCVDSGLWVSNQEDEENQDIDKIEEESNEYFEA